MNILFYVPQMASYGGMERHVCTLATEAARRGHRIRFLTTSNSIDPGVRASLLAAGVDLRELPRARGGAGAAEKMFWLWREMFLALPVAWDIIYTNGQSALSPVCWRAARERTRIIHHHHTAADALEQATWSPRFRRTLARAPELVACSGATRDNLAAALQAKPLFLPYFTAAPVARDAIADTRRTPGAPLHFGFVGRLVGTKGIDMLCALSLRPELANITWHIHGSGPDYPERYFARFPSIRYHGPYRDLAHYGQILQRLDAVALYTRHNEGMPLSLLEAMSAGLPWVATDRGGTRELARSSPDNTVVFSDAESEDAALAATLALASRIQNNTTSRMAQRAVYDARYSPEVVARAWFDYFERAPDEAFAKREGVMS